MFDTPEQILRQCRAGEASRTEFTEVRLREHGVIARNPDDLAADLVAFANCQLCA